MPFNPNPKKFMIRMRRGKPVLVDRAILRWRKARKARAEAQSKTLLDARGLDIGDNSQGGDPTPAYTLPPINWED